MNAINTEKKKRNETESRNGAESRREALKCLSFIKEGVSSFHVVKAMERQLEAAGFIFLSERDCWKIEKGRDYYVKRNDSSLIAFRVPEKESRGFHIVASHSDSPSFKLKEKPEINVEKKYQKLNVEPYGGMIYSTWLDRCLSVAGRLVLRTKGEPESVNVQLDEDLLVIPSLAIHMNREINKGVEYNPQIDLLPLFACGEGEETLMERLALAAKVKKEDILGKDLFLYVREEGRLAGENKEFIVSPRLDDLECVYASLTGILEKTPEEYISVCAVFDNEEVGSLTRQGAASDFLKNTLERAGEAMGLSKSGIYRLLAGSFMISADNAHGVHPNHPEKADPSNRPYLNEGIVIKYHGGQKYTTDAFSGAVMKSICGEAGVPFQFYANRSDIAGGSTLGNILSGQAAVPAADIGLAQLAMHSAVETAGSRDVEYLVKALKVFYEK